MTTEIQYRRGTTAEHATFTGALAEITVNTDNNSLIVHDGATAGGFETASIVGLATKADQSALDATDTAVTANTSAVLANATSLGLKANVTDLYTKISEPGSEGTAGQVLRTDGVGGRTWVDAVDTDTTYSVGDGGLTEINYTTALNTKLGDLDQGVATTDSPTFVNVTATGIVDVGDVLRVGANNSEMGNHYFRFKSTSHAYFDHSALTKDIIFRVSDAVAFDTIPLTLKTTGIHVTDVVVSGLVDGRDVATDGTKLDGIEALADVTDATNVAAAGALMEPTEGTSGYVLSTDGAGVRTWVAQTGGVTQGAVDLKADQTDFDTLEAVVVEGLGAFATDIATHTTDIATHTTDIATNTAAIAGISGGSGGSVNHEDLLRVGAEDLGPVNAIPTVDCGSLVTATPAFTGEVNPVLSINCSIGYQTFDLGAVA